MNVFLDYKPNETGKGKFLRRLIPALDKLGVSVRRKEKGCDVALGISWWLRRPPDMPRVLRVDGIHLTKGKKQAWRNERVHKAIKKSHGVIFQSQFARRTVKKRLGLKPKREYVIYNGADPADYKLAPMDLPHEKNVLMAARWANRKSKRLDLHLEVVDGYSNRPEVHFYLAGEAPPIKPRSNLTVLGHLPDNELRKWQCSCRYFIYMVPTDWCPNVVIEALVAGMAINWHRGSVVDELMLKKREEFYIDNIARQYKEALEEVLHAC